MKVKDRRPPPLRRLKRPVNRWMRATCWTCPERPSFLVYGPIRERAETYECVRCGLPMDVSIVAQRRDGEEVPSKRKRSSRGL